MGEGIFAPTPVAKLTKAWLKNSDHAKVVCWNLMSPLRCLPFQRFLCDFLFFYVEPAPKAPVYACFSALHKSGEANDRIRQPRFQALSGLFHVPSCLNLQE